MQAEWLRARNAQGDARSVVESFEGGRVAFTQDTLGEYVRALARTDRLDNGRVMEVMQAGAAAMSGRMAAAGLQGGPPGGTGAWPAASQRLQQSLQQRGGSDGYRGGQGGDGGGGTSGGMAGMLGFGGAATAAAGGAGGGAGAGEALGSTKNPLVMTFAEPSFSSQMWRTLRNLGTAFILVTCLSTLLDDKGGLTKGLLANPDLKPQHATNTKFVDVMGVDEVRVWT